jgi:ATP-dependent Clp protease ATP-binding subunit ClpX
MFEGPGSGSKHILITEAVAKREIAPITLGRGQQGQFHGLIAEEEDEWERRREGKEGSGKDGLTFGEYREKVMANGG